MAARALKVGAAGYATKDSDPALLLVMGLGGQLIHWPDEVVAALCELRCGDTFGCRSQYPRLDQATRSEYLSRLLGRWIGDESASVLFDADESFIGKSLQGGTCQSPADAEESADIAFGQFRSGCEPALDDRVANGLADLLRAAVGSVAGRQKRIC